MAWSNGYNQRRQITINHDRVYGSDHSNFPIYISKSANSLKGIEYGGDVINPSGYDIIFTSDENGSSLLKWEVEKYIVQSGEIIAHISDNISQSTDTTLYMFYGKNGISNFQGDNTSVWNSYVGVWHLNESPSGNVGDFKDSTVNSYNSINTDTLPSQTSGKISACTLYPGYKFLQFNTGAVGGTGLSIDAWFYITDFSNDRAFCSQRPNNWQLTEYSYNQIQFSIWTNEGQIAYTPSTVLPLNSWFHFCVTYDGSKILMFLNGVNILEQSESRSILTSDIPTYVGFDSYGGYFYGNIDEFRLSNYPKTSGWLITQYYNQVYPSDFVTMGELDNNSSSTPIIIIEED
jgi:hypothetical protein